MFYCYSIRGLYNIHKPTHLYQILLTDKLSQPTYSKNIKYFSQSSLCLHVLFEHPHSEVVEVVV